MFVTELVPRTLEVLDAAADGAHARAWLAQRYPRHPEGQVRLNMVSSLTGAAVGSDGTSESLTGGIDRLVLGTIRAAADAVIVGAATVRAEGYLIPRTATLVILTRTGDLTGLRVRADAGAPSPTPLVVCPAGVADVVRAAVSRLEARVLPLGGDAFATHEVLSALRSHGLRELVCEGGPTLASWFARADAIDEYCLTVAPAISPVAAPFLDVETPIDTDVAGHLVDSAGFSYLRLRRRR